MEKYIIAVVSAVAFLLTVIVGPVIIPVLKRLKFGQQIKEIGPTWHKGKSGTPTMGGFIFIIPVILVTLIFIRHKGALFLMVFSLLFGAIGFVDDFIKVIFQRNLGLTEKQKAFLQIFVSLLFVFSAHSFGITDTSIIIPIWGVRVSLNIIVYVIFALVVLVGASNSVNLTDGVDGLAASVSIVVCAFLSAVALKLHRFDIGLLLLVHVFALLAFLIFNFNPAKVFMGDTGSLYLGGLISMTAIILRIPLLLILAGAVYVLETLSVIVQVTSVKYTGRKIFEMTPVHHHLEMKGWGEKKIVAIATLVTIVLCFVSYVMCFNI